MKKKGDSSKKNGDSRNLLNPGDSKVLNLRPNPLRPRNGGSSYVKKHDDSHLHLQRLRDNGFPPSISLLVCINVSLGLGD